MVYKEVLRKDVQSSPATELAARYTADFYFEWFAREYQVPKPATLNTPERIKFFTDLKARLGTPKKK